MSAISAMKRFINRFQPFLSGWKAPAERLAYLSNQPLASTAQVASTIKTTVKANGYLTAGAPDAYGADFIKSCTNHEKRRK